jgi:uncharacterized protein YhbP (UPF0306 family)
MDKKIQLFIENEKNLTFCTSINNTPHCANCFYAFRQENNLLVFKSNRKTKHIENAMMNSRIAGTIIPDLHKTGTIKGLQYTGKFTPLSEELLEAAKKTYYLKFPFAMVMPGEFWAIELLTVKMVDSTLGFGKKLTWEKFPTIKLDLA